MANVKHYDLGDAVALVDDSKPEGAYLTLVQLGTSTGVARLNKAQVGRLLEGLAVPMDCGHEAALTNLRELLAQAHDDNDAAQAEIARLTEKPKRGRKPKADEVPAAWDEVPAEPVTDQGAQGPGDNVWTAGEWVEVIATGARAQVDRIFSDNPSKVQVLLGGSRPTVFDVSALRKAEAPAPEPSDVLDVEELIDGLEAVGLPVMTTVPTVAPSVPTVGTDEAEVVTTGFDPERLRRALYEDSKLYDFTPDEMKALITEVLGTLKSTKEMDTAELSAVLREMHERGRKARMPF
jgi:hypothetical protein